MLFMAAYLPSRHDKDEQVTEPGEELSRYSPFNCHEEGWIHQLLQGFHTALMRAFPLHGGVFLGYELAKFTYEKHMNTIQ